MISSFFKTRKPKQFNFSARYYDANKEELKERYDRIKGEMEGASREAGRHVDFKAQWNQRKNTSNFEKKSNFRLIIIVAILCFFFYYLLY